MKNKKYTYKNIKSAKRATEPSFNNKYRYWKITCQHINAIEYEFNFYDYTPVGRKEAIRKFLRDINKDEQSVMRSRFRPAYELRYGSYESRYGHPEPKSALILFDLTGPMSERKDHYE